MKIWYWFMMEYCDYRLNRSMTYRKRLYWFARFMFYREKVEADNQNYTKKLF